MFKTISVTAKTLGIPCATLRRMVKQNRVPGFYGGRVYYVNVEKFREQLSKPDTGTVSA